VKKGNIGFAIYEIVKSQRKERFFRRRFIMCLSVLVIDDDKTVREAISEYLAVYDVKCFQAYDSIDAIEMLHAENIDIAIIDVRMPKMNGLLLLKAIKQVRPQFPVILMTGFNLTKKEISQLPYKADAYITKPFSLKSLMALMFQYAKKESA
jgi:DNA-binding response OmpR family regulator